MPLQLTSPISTGDLSDNSLTHVKVNRFRVDVEHKRLEFGVRFGYYEGASWVEGEYQPRVRHTFIIRDGTPEEGDDEAMAFTDLMNASTPLNLEERHYDGVARSLYQWLIDNDHFEGSIV